MVVKDYELLVVVDEEAEMSVMSISTVPVKDLVESPVDGSS
jgi:hypothetical protein